MTPFLFRLFDTLRPLVSRGVRHEHLRAQVLDRDLRGGVKGTGVRARFLEIAQNRALTPV
jgi:hypothetical protein